MTKGRMFAQSPHGLLLRVYLCCLLCWHGATHASEVLLATLQSQGEQAHVELLLDQPVRYRLFALENPYRVVLDLEGVSVNATLKALPPQLSAQHPYVAKVRIAPFSESVTRLVFDIKGNTKPQFIDLNPNAGQQQRLAITIAPYANPSEPAAGSGDKPISPVASTPPANVPNNSKVPEPATPAPTALPTPLSTPVVSPVTMGQSNNESGEAVNEAESGVKSEPIPKPAKKTKIGQRLITIAVDAGHGGEDPGAKGARGSHEKNITLAIAQRLKAKIDAEEDMQAILIRDGDYFVPLGDRVKKARAAKADLFISIHADSFINSSARGSSVFALSERGATSAGARYLAKKENEVDLIGGIPLNTKDMDLARTLLDLSQTATIHDSIRLGKAVLKRIAKINSLHSNYVEQAAFAVLKAPDIPSILVETAFISNPEEEARLNDDDYQEKLVAAILGGVKAFVATNPAFAKR